MSEMEEKGYAFPLYWTVLRLLHFVFKVIEVMYVYFVIIVNSIRCKLGNADEDFQTVKENARKIEKLPKHLLFIMGNEEPSFKDLASLVVWCIASDIQFLSFYDHRGILKKMKVELYKAVLAKRKGIESSIIWRDLSYNGVSSFKRNGYNPITINVFSLSESRSSIVKITKQLCKSGISASDIDVDTVNAKFHEMLGELPDPDAAIYCGLTCSTYGCLPWQLRNTEFFGVVSHHNLTVHSFLRILRQYGKVEKRFGK